MADSQVYIGELPPLVTEIETFIRFSMKPVPIKGLRIFYGASGATYGFMQMYNKQDADRVKAMKNVNFSTKMVTLRNANKYRPEMNFLRVESIAERNLSSIGHYRPNSLPMPIEEDIATAQKLARKQMYSLTKNPKYLDADDALPLNNPPIAQQQKTSIWRANPTTTIATIATAHPTLSASSSDEWLPASIQLSPPIPTARVELPTAPKPAPVRILPEGAVELENWLDDEWLSAPAHEPEIVLGKGLSTRARVSRVWTTEPLEEKLRWLQLNENHQSEQKKARVQVPELNRAIRHHLGRSQKFSEKENRAFQSARFILDYNARLASQESTPPASPDGVPERGLQTAEELSRLVFHMIDKTGAQQLCELNDAFSERYGYRAQPMEWFHCSWLHIVTLHPELLYDENGVISIKQ